MKYCNGKQSYIIALYSVFKNDFFFLFETGSLASTSTALCAAEDDLEVLNFLPIPPEC